jgi:hypothetical protein
MRNAKTLAIVVVLGLGLIFSSRLLAQEAQTGGLPTLEDRVDALAIQVAADHALILEIETDLGEINTQITALKGSLTRTFVFNDNTELSSSTTVTVAGPLSVTVGEFDGASHRLVINYSSVGAIAPLTATPALLFIGCFVDGTTPCVGSQANPGGIPAGYVNVLSTDFSAFTAWDNSVDHVWYTATKLSPGSHTVTIKAAVGNPLVTTVFGTGNGTGTLFDEARNLVVTVLGSAD